MQFYLYFFNNLIKALLKASPFLWWCFLKCFELTFTSKPLCIWIISQKGLYFNNSITNSISLDYSSYKSSLSYSYSVLLEDIPENFNSFIVGGQAIKDRFISKYTGLGAYITRYSTSDSYTRGEGYGWGLSLGKWSNNTYSWYFGDFQQESNYWTALKTANAEYQLNSLGKTYYYLAIYSN